MLLLLLVIFPLLLLPLQLLPLATMQTHTLLPGEGGEVGTRDQ